MRNSPLIVVLLLSLVLPACSSVPSHNAPPPGPAATAPEPSEAAAPEGESGEENAEEEHLPNVELNGNLLYQILESEMALQRQRFDVGVSGYLRLAQETRDPRLAERAAQAALFAHEDEQGLQAARIWIELEPEKREAQQMLVVAAIRTGNLDEAMAHMETLLSPSEGPPEDRFELMASLLSREHDAKEAYKLMERYVASHEDDADARFAAAQLALRAGEYQGARDMIDRALELRPDWYNAIALRVRVVLMSEGQEPALAYLKESVDRYPDDTNLRMAYARTLTDLHRYDEALAEYDKLTQVVKPNTEIFLTMGLINLELDRVDQAEKDLDKVKKSGEHAVDMPFYQGWIEEKRGHQAQALQRYAAVTSESANYFEARVRVAILTANQGDIVSARAQLKQLREQEPTQQKRLYEVEAELLRQAHMYKEGMDVLNISLDQFPRDFELLYYRALMAEDLDQLDVLERDLKTIIDADPNHVDALNALGYTLADRTDRYKEAYDYIKRALDLAPDNNAILDSMGWVLYRLGNYDESLKYLRRSLEVKKDPEVAAHLGEVLWVSDHHDEAKTIWNEALAEFPDKNDVIRETMKRFGL